MSRPGVVVVPSVHGVDGYVDEVLASLDTAGFDAVAVDYYEGTAPTDLDTQTGMLGALSRCSQDRVVSLVGSATDELVGDDGRPVALLGFCIGGTFAWHAAAADIGRYAALGLFYPNLRLPGTWDLDIRSPVECARRPQLPVVAHFGDMDEFVTDADVEQFARWHPPPEGAVHVYPGAGHAFHDSSRSDRFQSDLADLAWQRTVAFFEERLVARRKQP